MIKKKNKSYLLNFFKKNKLKKIYNILNKKIIDYDQLKNINQYLEFNKIQKLYKNGINKILDTTVLEDNHIKKIKKLQSFDFRKDLLNKTKSKIKTYLDQKFSKKNSRKTLLNKLNLNKFSSFLDILKDKNIQINIEKQNVGFKKKGPLKNYFFYYRFSKILEKLKYQYLLKKFNKKNLLINKNSLKNYLSKKLSLKDIEKSLNNFKLFSNVKAKALKSQDKPEHIAILYYCDHFLFISKLWKSEQKGIVVEGVIELPIPAKVIGDNLITNIDELIELALDSFEVLKLSNPPILVVLASSLFNIKSFNKKAVKIIEEKNEVIQSKSPYLPEDTFTEFQIFKENTFNAIYVRKTLIRGWIKLLKKIKSPVIGITTPGPHQLDILRENKKIISELEIIIDIELSSSTVFTFNKLYQISSQKLPYGSFLYRKEELINSYFSRLTKSIKLITNDLKLDFPEKIYVFGFGLDDFESTSEKLPYPFVKFTELNQINHEFPEINKSKEIVNKEFNSKLNTILGITNRCL